MRLFARLLLAHHPHHSVHHPAHRRAALLLFSLISADRCGKEHARYDSEHDLFHGLPSLSYWPKLFEILWHVRCWSRWSIVAIGFVDVCPDFFQSLAFVHHLHHVTRDAYADLSTDAHGVELWLRRRRVILDVAGRIARVTVVYTSAITWNEVERFSIKDGETITVTDFGRGIPKSIGKDGDRSQLVDVAIRSKRENGSYRKRTRQKQSIQNKVASVH